MKTGTHIASMLALTIIAGSAAADITVTQTAAQGATYSTTLNFDEPGGPTGNGLADNLFAGIGLASLASGDGFQRIGNFDAETGSWGLGGGTNSFTGNFGVFMTFDSDITNFSAQVWDPSGPGSFLGGGMTTFAFNDGVEVGSFYSDAGPAWGGVGDEWWNISATNGMVFDEVRILGFGFTPTTYIDNISWNAVPTPSSMALLGLGGLVITRRRR
jgi:uncharacterized protein (TIGR03382 family)